MEKQVKVLVVEDEAMIAMHISMRLRSKGFKVVELKRLPQQESITYLPDSKSLLYNSEYVGIKPKLVQINCLE